MALLRQQIKAEWLSLAVWSLILFLLTFYAISLWEVMAQSGAIAEIEQIMATLPAGVRAAYGLSGSLGTLQGWVQLYGYGAWLALIYVVYTGLFVTSMVTREVDRRTIEFLLSLPVHRWQVLLTRWLGLAVSLLVLHTAQFAGVWAGVASIGAEPDLGGYALASLNSWLLYLALGSIFLVVSLFIDDYVRGVALIIGVGFGLYFAHVGTADATGWMKELRSVIPFSFNDAHAILAGGAVPVGHLMTLGIIGLAGLGLSIFLFQRKQISV